VSGVIPGLSTTPAGALTLNVGSAQAAGNYPVNFSCTDTSLIATYFEVYL